MSSDTHNCDNCGKLWPGPKLKPVKDIFQRVEPGGVTPSGECPECGARCYTELRREEHAQLNNCNYQRLLAASTGLRCQTCHGSGECNDADPGDIGFSTWTCEDCGGDGITDKLRKIKTFMTVISYVSPGIEAKGRRARARGS